MDDKHQSKGISSSSMLDLRAELLRKKEEFQREKVLGPGNRQRNVTKEKKSNIWSRSNAGVRERAEKDLEAKKEEDDVLAKSRKMLEAKARAYEKLVSGNIIPDEETSQRFLVDFEQKSIDKLIEQKHRDEDTADSRADKQIKDSMDKQHFISREIVPEENLRESVDPGGKWVDYVDSLGRSRRCMEKDLPELKKMDRELVGKKTLLRDADINDSTLPELMSDDMYKERLRAKWEEEERRNMEQPESHYANVQFDEVRDHGVAFYQFDKDAETRQQQMKKLAALREKTKQNRDAQQQLKKKRKAMMAARLAKVRQRKLIREGKDPNEITDLLESLGDSDSDDEDMLKSDLNGKSKDEPETSQRDDSWCKTVPVREWDKGKEGLDEFLASRTVVHSEESWKEKLRRERPTEFAPPSIYQDKKHVSGIKPPHTVEGKPLFGKCKKLKVESEMLKGGDGDTNIGDKQSECITQDVDQILAKIRAEVESKNNRTAKSVTKSGEGRLHGEPVNLAEIPLPPTSSVINEQASTSAMSSDIRVKLGQSSCQDTVSQTQYYEAQQWSSAGVEQYRNNGSQAYQTTYLAEGIQNTQPNAEQPTAVMGAEIYASQPSTADGSTVPAPLMPEPQPAHYSSGPMKPQAPKARYERVNLHELPLELPAPPAINNVPEYPSQEEVFGAQKKHVETTCHKKTIKEEEAVKLWKRQFDFQNKPKSATLKPDNVPFATSYIQSSLVNQAGSDPAFKFDPSKPPPKLT